MEQTSRIGNGFQRLLRDLKPDLVHAGPIQTCAFIAVLAGASPLLTMSWGFDLMDDVHKGWMWEFATKYTLKRSTFFTSDANVTKDKAVAYGMNPEKTIVFPWGVDLEHFNVRTFERAALSVSKGSNVETFTSSAIAPGKSVTAWMCWRGHLSKWRSKKIMWI
jgi:hypothetical protein